MKGMYWAWVAALLMGLGIVTFVNLVSRPTERSEPVFSTEEKENRTSKRKCDFDFIHGGPVSGRC